MTIQQQLVDLENKKYELEKLKEQEDVQTRLNDFNTRLKGKVLCHYVKGSAKSRVMLLTHYQEFFIGDSYRDNKPCKVVKFKGEEIRIKSNLYGGYDSEYLPFKDNTLNGDVDSTYHIYHIYKKKEISLEVFKQIKNYIKSLTDNLFGFVDEDITPLFEITNGESDDLRKIDDSAKLLDIKHIVLEKDRETWLLSKSIFLNGNVFLLTPASMRWLSDWKHQQMMSDSSGRAMCAAVGERYRSSRYSEVVELVTKIQKASNEQHDK